MKKEVQLAVQTIVAQIADQFGKVRLQAHIQDGIWTHYSGGSTEKLGREAIDAIVEAEELFCNDPLKWLDSAFTGSLIKSSNSDAIGYALGCIGHLVGKALEALQRDRASAPRASLRELIGGGQNQDNSIMAIDQAKAMPQIGEIVAVYCLKVRETARREEIRRRCLEIEQQTKQRASELEARLQQSGSAITRHEQRIAELEKQLSSAEQTGKQLETANRTCEMLHQRIAATRQTFNGAVIGLIVSIVIAAAGFVLTRFRLEPSEAGNYAAFGGLGLLLAFVLTLILLPERKK